MSDTKSTITHEIPGAEPPNPVDALAEEFVARLRAGERPSITEYVQRHRELADEIQAVFPTLAVLEQFGNEGSLTGEQKLTVPAIEQLGDYHIVREIGRGGMGVVYEAEHASMRRRVALKVMPAEMSRNPTHLQRFRREARAAGGLHHTNIVPVFEVGQHESVYYYSMQYIRGQSLDLVIRELRKLVRGQRQKLENYVAGVDESTPPQHMDSIAARLLSGQFGNSPSSISDSTLPSSSTTDRMVQTAARSIQLPQDDGLSDEVLSNIGRAGYFRRVARLGLQVADALSYAHGQGVLHRDIKPSNLILDTAGIVWITDFGLAKYDEDDLTRSGDVIGTLRYLAPERLNGVADARSDVYSLGLTLYELCVWRPAFDESDRVRLIKQVTSERAPSPRRLNKHVPRDLETIILKAIDKHPGSRFESAEQMAEDLRLFLADRPLQSRRIPVWEKTWRWCRRNPIVAALAASVLLLLGILCGSSIWFGISSNQQAEQLRIKSALVEHSEKETLAALFDARRSHAQAARYSGRRGQRVDGLSALRDAALVLPRLSMPRPDREAAQFTLRTDAIASLAKPDLRIDRSWSVPESWSTVVDFDSEFQRYAQADAEGNVVVRNVSDNKEHLRIPSPGCPAWDLQFSPNGKYLAGKFHPPRARPQYVCVWDLETQQRIVCDQGPFLYAPFAFGKDSQTLVVSLENGLLHTYELPTGTLRPDAPKIEMPMLKFALDPSGKFFVGSDSSKFQIARMGMDGVVQEQIDTNHYFRSLIFSDEGSVLAGGCEDGDVYLWNPEKLSDPPRILKGHTAAVVNIAFNHAGDRLMSYSWDGTTRLWDLQTKRQLVRADAVRLLGNHWSPDDRWIGYASKRDEFGIWQALDRGPANNLISSAVARIHVNFPAKFDSLALSSTWEGIELWDTATPRLLGLVPSGPSTMAKLLPDRSAIISGGTKGLLRWPISVTGSTWLIGQPEVISANMTKQFDVDADGRYLAALQMEEAFVFDLSDRSPSGQSLGTHPRAHQIDISPDGRWVVTTTWQNGSGIRIWDRAAKSLATELESDMGAATATFSPDGQWLATGVWKHFALWKVGTWNQEYQIDRPVDDDWFGSIAFTPDSKAFAGLNNRRSIQLIETATGKCIAIIESSDPEIIADIQFNADGSQLAVVVDNRLQVWNFDQLHEELTQIGLGQESFPVSTHVQTHLTPDRIEIASEQ